ncbi:MAG: hypothetical protein ACPLYC_00595, partial [Minisyncoccia bacterium]
MKNFLKYFFSLLLLFLVPFFKLEAVEINAGDTGLPGDTGHPTTPSGGGSSGGGSSGGGGGSQAQSNIPSVVNMDSLNNTDMDEWLNNFNGPPSNVPFGTTWTGPSGQEYVLTNTGLSNGLSNGAWVPVGSSSPDGGGPPPPPPP